ncbi:MAG: ABC transporter ATP-binding protein [Planctomycetota bacterium]
MISAHQLRFRYPRSDFELDLPELEINKNERVAVVGPSGCGKTTLLNLLSGIALPDSGQVTVNGIEISSLSDAARRNFRIANIGMVFQQFELVEYLDLKANILLPFYINQSLKLCRETEQRAESLAQEMGLGNKLKRRPSQLSQGEQQRCAICRALITQPTIILADEPTGNLDPKNKQLILELVHQQVEKHQMTLIVVTHDMSLLDQMDRTIDFETMRVEAPAGDSS